MGQRPRCDYWTASFWEEGFERPSYEWRGYADDAEAAERTALACMRAAWAGMVEGGELPQALLWRREVKLESPTPFYQIRSKVGAPMRDAMDALGLRFRARKPPAGGFGPLFGAVHAIEVARIGAPGAGCHSHLTARATDGTTPRPETDPVKFDLRTHGPGIDDTRTHRIGDEATVALAAIGARMLAVRVHLEACNSEIGAEPSATLRAGRLAGIATEAERGRATIGGFMADCGLAWSAEAGA